MDPISDIVWKKKYKINNWNVTGYSIAGLKTSFYISDLNILLDAGFQNFNKPEHIFITHLHADHIGNLHLTILENINSNVCTKIICPVESVLHLKNFINSFLSCNYHYSMDVSKFYTIHGMKSNEKIELFLNKKKFIIEAIKSDHIIPTLSYGFNFVSNKLKEEYKDLDGKSLGQLKKSGININYEKTTGVLLFVGDTTNKIFDNKNVFNYTNIIIECTFFNKDDLMMSSVRKHMHWLYLNKIINNNSDIKFHIIHVSSKHIHDYFDKIDDIDGINNLNFLY